MSAGRAGPNALNREMLHAVAARKVVLNTARGAWLGPKPDGPMGGYEYVEDHVLDLARRQALIELRNAGLIVTVPVAGEQWWDVVTTPAGRSALTRWSKAVKS